MEAEAPARRFTPGIRGRVALAMLLPLALALGVSGWVSVESVSRTVESRERRRIQGAASLLEQIARSVAAAPARSEFLETVGKALGGDLAVHDRSAASVHTTLPEAQDAAFRRMALDGRMAEEVPAGAPTGVEVAGERCLVLRESLAAQDVYLVYPGDPVGDAVAEARRPLLLAGAGALVAAGLLAVLLASLITHPLKRLAVEAAVVAGGDLDREVVVRSRDETGELAASFNRMLAGLRAYRADLVRAERLAVLGRVATGIAHEIRNPLTAIRMNVQMFPEEDDATHRAEDAATILEEIDRLERAVDDLLAIARPEPPRRAPVDLSALAGAVRQLLARQLDHLGVRTELETPAGGGPVVAGDERRLRQVLVNLLLNAAQAMPGGGTARVRVEEAEGRARIVVEDGGGGIPDDLATRLFEPFVSARSGGTGLGLAVCRQLIVAHGGTIDFRPIPGGTAFTVSLPPG